MRNVRTDSRTGNLFSRPCFKLPDGSTVRKYVTPGEFGLPNTAKGLMDAERQMAIRLAGGTTTTTVNPSPNPNPPAATDAALAPKEVPTLAAFATKHWLPRNGHDNKPATTKQKAKLVRMLVDQLGAERRLDAIDTRTVDEWIRSLQGRYARTSQGVLATALRSILLLAAEYGMIAKAPKVAIARKRTERAERPLFWTPAQCDRVVAAAREPYRTMIDVASRTGLRIGELRALRWDNVDLDTGTIHVTENYVLGKVGTPKGNRAREVALSDGCRALLRALRERTGGARWVFSQDGRQLGRNALYAELKRAADAAGLALPRGKAWHVLRHTYGTVLSGGAGNPEDAVPMPIVRDQLGHADLRETQGYTHSDPVSRARAAQRIDRGRTSPPTAPLTAAPTALAA